MKISNILVPIKGSTVDDQAIRLACITARQYKAKLYVLHVIELRRSLPLEAENAPEIQRAEEILERASRIAREERVQIQTELLQARAVGPVLLDEASERGTDLIILGLPYRQPLEEFYIGTTPRYILKNAPCPVWLCREQAAPPLKEEKKK